MQFWRSWLELSSEEEAGCRRGINWGAILGITVTAGISVGFWTSVGLLIARLVR